MQLLENHKQHISFQNHLFYKSTKITSSKILKSLKSKNSKAFYRNGISSHRIVTKERIPFPFLPEEGQQDTGTLVKGESSEGPRSREGRPWGPVDGISTRNPAR